MAKKKTDQLTVRQRAGLNREAWLTEATNLMRPWFAAAGHPLPAKVHCSVGFPSSGALARNRRKIGQCWSMSVSEDGHPHVFLHPELPEDAKLKGGKRDAHCTVLPVLVHELVHAAVGTECGHKGAFVRLARELGLEGKPTATFAGVELLGRLDKLRKKLGPYPHAVLKAGERKRQATRMKLMECGCKPPRKLRVSRQQAEAGPILCGLCDERYELQA